MMKTPTPNSIGSYQGPRIFRPQELHSELEYVEDVGNERGTIRV